MSPPLWVSALRPSEPDGPDLLAKERGTSQIDVDRLANYVYGDGALKRQERVLAVLEHDDAFDKSQNYFEGRIDRYKRALVRAKRLSQLKKQHGWDEDELVTAIELIGEPTSYTLHWVMFVPTLRQQGTPEQHGLFLKRAEDLEIIGCYAQTELGHGSNVQGLETTATWSPQEKVFVLNSPSLTASKWWAGTLGRTANFAIVMAQLVIDNLRHGPHPFVCQIRDLQTHEPLDGVYIGDIGPKLGYNTMDNGFMLLRNVKIPHVNMLARFARVDPETNRYIRPATPALIYGSLTRIRAGIVSDSGRSLARGTTIATRYCAIRRQFTDKDDRSESEELQVLDYTMVQARLLPLIATSYAMRITGNAMMALYRQAAAALPGDNQSSHSDELKSKQLFAELHATSCGLKSLATNAAAEGLEVCRRACGGHGYSNFSGIGSWYADYVPATTYEGDNFMLTQQVAKYLMDTARDVLRGNAPHNATGTNLHEYLSRRSEKVRFDLSRNEDIVRSFAWRAAYLTFRTLERRDQKRTPWNKLLVDFWRLSTAQSQFLTVQAFYDDLSSDQTSAALDGESHRVLWRLFQLYGLHTVAAEAHEFYVSSALSIGQVEEARDTQARLLEEIRPHAVRLVDAWKLPDWLLDSSLGRSDGRVYEDLFHRASQMNPLNRIVPDPRPDSVVVIQRVLSPVGMKSML